MWQMDVYLDAYQGDQSASTRMGPAPGRMWRDLVWRVWPGGGELLGLGWWSSETRLFYHHGPLFIIAHFLVSRWVGRGHLPANDVITGRYRYGQDPAKMSFSGRKSLNKC